MQPSSPRPSVFIIAGMHRSGTSLTASILEQAGLDVGQRLIGANPGNRKGYFENLDFVDFHERLLEANGLHKDGWTPRNVIGEIPVPPPFVERAQALIRQNEVSACWGWKDPRTTLFLEFWRGLLPDACFIFLYRAPWEVVDSLYRRADPAFLDHPEWAVQSWIDYNRKVLAFVDAHPEQSYLAHIDRVARNAGAFIAALNARFGTALTVPTQQVYDKSLMGTAPWSAQRASLIAQAYPEAIDLYRQLHSRQHLPGPPLDAGVDQSKNAASLWPFQDWALLRAQQRQGELVRQNLIEPLRTLKRFWQRVTAFSRLRPRRR